MTTPDVRGHESDEGKHLPGCDRRHTPRQRCSTDPGPPAPEPPPQMTRDASALVGGRDGAPSFRGASAGFAGAAVYAVAGYVLLGIYLGVAHRARVGYVDSSYSVDQLKLLTDGLLLAWLAIAIVIAFATSRVARVRFLVVVLAALPVVVPVAISQVVVLSQGNACVIGASYPMGGQWVGGCGR